MKSDTQTSKFLSLILRHRPDKVGLTLDPDGWVDVDRLLAAMGEHGHRLERAELERVVAENNKKRFAFDPTGTRIRASQGHSLDVDLCLEPRTPPDLLFHGTVARTLASISREGLRAMSRRHVHLSPDRATAEIVGKRRGAPVILEIDSAAMAQDGHAFYLSDNGVWLTDAVPASYLRNLEELLPPD